MTDARSLASFLRFIIIGATISVLTTSCGGDSQDRPEVITKLRAVGVEQTPVIAKPGDTVTLTFFLAAPSGLTITPQVLLDAESRYGVSTLVAPLDQTPTETAAGPLSIYSYRASLIVPKDNQVVTAGLGSQGFARLRYKINFTTDSDSEAVVGDSIVYPNGAPQLNWQAPTVSIDKPDTSSPGGDLDLQGGITSDGGEPYRVSWFVSSGTVKNRRARTTKWQDPAKGSQTLILTVRGTRSGAFAIKSKAVTIN